MLYVTTMLRISTTRIRDLCQMGKLDGFKDGRWKVSKDSIEAYIACKIEAAKPPETEAQKFVKSRRGADGKPRIVTRIK